MDVKTVKEQDGTWFVLFCFVFFVVREKEKATTRLGWWTGRKKFGFYRVFFSCFRPSGFVRLTPRFSFFFPSTTSSWAHLSDSSSLSLSLSHTQTLLESRKRGQRTESWTPFSFLFFYFFFCCLRPVASVSTCGPTVQRPFFLFVIWFVSWPICWSRLRNRSQRVPFNRARRREEEKTSFYRVFCLVFTGLPKDWLGWEEDGQRVETVAIAIASSLGLQKCLQTASQRNESRRKTRWPLLKWLELILLSLFFCSVDRVDTFSNGIK